MLKVLNRRMLKFSFPEVHKDAVLKIEFIRTFRVPDDGRLNALPPGFEPFEVDEVEKYPSKVPCVSTQGFCFRCIRPKRCGSTLSPPMAIPLPSRSEAANCAPSRGNPGTPASICLL